jgi:hypothetical protein
MPAVTLTWGILLKLLQLETSFLSANLEDRNRPLHASPPKILSDDVTADGRFYLAEFV